MFENMTDQLEASCKIETVRNSFIKGCTDIDAIPDFLMSVRHQNLFLVECSDRDHDRACTVIVEMMVDCRAFDGTEIRNKNCRIVRLYDPKTNDTRKGVLDPQFRKGTNNK